METYKIEKIERKDPRNSMDLIYGPYHIISEKLLKEGAKTAIIEGSFVFTMQTGMFLKPMVQFFDTKDGAEQYVKKTKEELEKQ